MVEPQSQQLTTWTPRFALTVNEAVELVDQKREFMKRVMRENEHYGVIPGTKGKPSLFKPGAELLLSSMGLHPRYRDTAPAIEDWTGADHGGEPFFRYRRTCMITRSTGPGPDDYMVVAEASGNCNSWEKKYRYRASDRTCPTCGKKGTVIKGKDEYGGGWLCFKKRNGCGAKFAYNDKRIIDQVVGDVPNPDISDLVNTLEKMADKRALVAATLLATGCSDIFTQDLEDGGGDEAPAVDQDGVIANPSQASVDALRTAQVAQGSPPAAIQPAPPSSGPTPTDKPVQEPSAPSVVRSVGPRAKRQNVVQAPQGAQGERSTTAVTSEQAGSHVAPLDAGGGQKAVAAVTSAPPVTLIEDEPQDGREQYLAALRQQAREVAAQVVYLRVKRGNLRNKDAIALGTMAPVELPPWTPHAGADASLSAFITSQHTEGKLTAGTLAELPEDELTKTVLGTLEEIVKRLEKEGITAP